MARIKTVISFSVLDLGWDNDISKGMPSIYLLLKGLVNSGYSVHYVIFKKCKMPSHFVTENIHIYTIPFSFVHINTPEILYYFSDWLYYWLLQIKMSKILKEMMSIIKPDIIVGNTRYCARIASKYGKKYKIPVIYREYGTNDMIKLLDNLLMRILIFPRIRAFKSDVTKYILTDDGTMSDKVALNLGVSPNKVVFLKNGYSPVVDSCVDQNRVDKFVISVAARLSPEKHFDFILEALCKCRNLSLVQLYIIGSGPDKDKLENLSAHLGVDKNVSFIGSQTRHIVIEYFKNSDLILALGSINPLIEAMSCGKTAVTLNLGSTNNFVTNGVTGYVLESLELEKLRDLIDYCVENREEIKRIGTNAKSFVESNFETWESRVNKEIEIYDSLIGGRK